MLLRLFLGFTLIPMAELYLLIEIGSHIGAAATIGIVLLTGFVGAYLARMQGFATMMRIRENLNQGITPAEDLVDAAMILVAGVVLLTPGFLTDICGLLLLFPPSRLAIKRSLRRRFDRWMSQGRVTVIHRR